MSRKGISFGKISFKSTKPSENTKENQEGSTSGFGTFGRTPIQESKEIDEIADDLESQQIQQAIGVKNFGKKAKNVDIEEMVEQARKAAHEASKRKQITAEVPNADEDDNDDSDLIGPPLPPNIGTTDKEDLIGPPIPPATSNSKNKRKDDSEGEDSYDELSGSDDEDLSLDKRIPYTHEVRLQNYCYN